MSKLATLAGPPDGRFRYFASLRYELRGDVAGLVAFVARWEREWRDGLGLADWSDEDIVVATQQTFHRTDLEIAVLRVIRAYIRVRERYADGMMTSTDDSS